MEQTRNVNWMEKPDKSSIHFSPFPPPLSSCHTRAPQNAEKGLVSEDEYARLVEQVNVNRRQLEEDARGLDEALKQLGLGGAEKEEIPTLSFAQFQEREMPRMKEEKPGLKLPQYRDLIWKQYERAIENPRSQARKDYEAGLARKESMAQQGQLAQ